MANNKTSADIRLLVGVESKTDGSYSGRTLRLNISPVVITDGKLRNPSYGSDDTSGEYEGLSITGYCDPDDKDFWFGTLLSFDTYRVDLHRAERLVKTLRRTQRRLDALESKRGRPVDSTDQIARLAEAIGCQGSLPFVIKTGGSGWSYDDFTYQNLTIDGLRSFIQKSITEWQSS